VADRLETLHLAHRSYELSALEAPARSLELAFGESRIVRADQAHLERARTGIDDEYAHPVA
jgi:hypothetical protein